MKKILITAVVALILLPCIPASAQGRNWEETPLMELQGEKIRLQNQIKRLAAERADISRRFHNLLGTANADDKELEKLALRGDEIEMIITANRKRLQQIDDKFLVK